MTNWTFLTNHARALLCILRDPEVRLRDLASSLGITERRAYDIIGDLIEDGYVIKMKEGRRNRYAIQSRLPLPEHTGRDRPIGDVLEFLTGPGPFHPRRRATD